MFFGKRCRVVGPHSEVGEVAIFTTQGVGKNHAGPCSVNILGFAVITGMLDGIGRNRDRPQLAWINLWKRSWRLPPPAPIKFCFGDERSNLGIGIPLRMISRTAFFPKMVEWSRPATIRQGPDTHFRVEDVLPKGFDIGCVRHQCPKTNDGNGLKGPLVDSFARFAVFCGQGHDLTSIHDALWYHGYRIACINVDALPCNAS